MTSIIEKKGIKGRVRIIQTKAGTDEVVGISEWTENLVMNGTDTGINVILDRLGGTLTYTLDLSYGDIGTGNTAAAVSDTTLQTVTARAARVYSAVSGSTLTVRYFFTDAALANGTYREFGTFMDGTSTVSTGKIFNRVVLASPYVKTAGIDSTIEVQFTIS